MIGFYRITVTTWNRRHFRLHSLSVFQFGDCFCFCLPLGIFEKLNSIRTGFKLNILHVISLCSWHPLKPKCWVLFSHKVLCHKECRPLCQSEHKLLLFCFLCQPSLDSFCFATSVSLVFLNSCPSVMVVGYPFLCK